MSVHCTIPSEVVRYVSSPNARGTLDILWSSLATVVLCTWTVLKLPILLRPPEMGKWNWKICLYVRKSISMVSTIIAPELLVGTALDEYFSVRSSIVEMKEQAKKDGVEWSRTHSYFANMRGFAVCFGIQKAPDSQNIDKVSQVIGIQKPPDSQYIDKENQVISRNRKLGEEAIKKIEDSSFKDKRKRRDVQNVKRLQGNEWSLNTDQLLHARKLSMIASLPNIPEDMLGDLSKSDGVTQLLTLVQLIWLYLELIFRALENLPVTQLEITVLGFSFCAFLAYCLEWNKSKDVYIRFAVYADRGFKDADELIQLLGSKGPLLHRGFFRILKYDARGDGFDHYLFGAALTGVVFGFIHLSAWNFAFPTDREKRLWRAASIICIVVPCILMVRPLITYLSRECDKPDSYCFQKLDEFRFKYDPDQFIESAFFFIYILARGYIIFEVIRALFFLPPKAFSTTWTVNWPQIG